VLRVGFRAGTQAPECAAQIARDGDVVEIDAASTTAMRRLGSRIGSRSVGSAGAPICAPAAPTPRQSDLGHPRATTLMIEGLEFSGAKCRTVMAQASLEGAA